VAFLRDVSAQVQAEQERVALQQRIIEAQREALRELGTPLVPIADQVLAMPVVGMLDGERAQQMLATLLEGIAAQRARVAILDVTGVKFAGAEVADALIRAARAAGLLGAEVVLTGIGPSVAQALVELEAELRGITVRGTLQSGIAYALGGARGRR
jgi:anti-anti-sigma regulatory factor